MPDDPPRLIDGPRCAAASGKTTSLVVFVHGFGANGPDLFSLAEPLSGVLRESAFAAPNAPEACELGGGGFQWFGLIGPGGGMEVREAGADHAAPALARFLESELARYGLDSSRLALVGFSQGTMMSLHVGLRLSPAPAAIVGFSGMLVAAERLAAEPHGAPPVLLVHGTADPMLPFAAMADAEAGLRAAGIPVETLARPGLGHSIDEAGLTAAARFLVRHLGS
ncbi:MAG TPA: dienelactone hydrolase family protein [Stellaceae bacterium]|nr:dienelactone hydrolase family protein [Stellaceae bacterium]